MAIKFDTSADFGKVLKEYDALQRRVIGLEEKLRGVTKEVRTQGPEFGNTFKGALGDLKAMLTGYASVSGAIQLVNAGLREQKKLGEEANRTQQTIGQSQYGVVKMLGDVSRDQVVSFLKSMETVAQASGFKSVIPINQAAENVLSVTGANQELTRLVLENTAPMMADNEQGMTDLSATVASMAKMTGAKTDEDIEKLIGFGLSTLAQARITGPEKLKELSPVLSAGMSVSSGTPIEQVLKTSAAGFAALGGALDDPSGAQTKTGWINFESKLAEFLPDQDVMGPEGVVTKGTGLKNTTERLKAMWADEKLRQKFWASPKHGGFGATFEAAVEPQLRRFLEDPNSSFRQSYDQAQNMIAFDPGFYRRMLGNFSATSQMGLAESSRRSAGMIEGLESIDPKAAVNQVENETVELLRKTRGSSYWGSWSKMMGEWARSPEMGEISMTNDPAVAVRRAESHLKRRRSELLHEPEPMFSARSYKEIMAEREAREKDPKWMAGRLSQLTEGERKMIEAIDAQTAEFRRLVAAFQQGNGPRASADLRNQREGN